jgi:ABC-2 type transport system ATP-binding protein/lipopolysaccharide transport system ATP-binding protein
MRRQGTAVVFVSHVLEQVRELCDRVLWLEAGAVEADGPAEDVLGHYEARHAPGGRGR